MPYRYRLPTASRQPTRTPVATARVRGRPVGGPTRICPYRGPDAVGAIDVSSSACAG